MSTNSRAPSAMGSRTTAGGAAKRSYFEQQREILIGEIAMSFEHVLANINKLNRSLEAVITVGNEFSSVEALWSQFEGVMAKEEDTAGGAGASAGAGAGAGAGADNREDEGVEDERHAHAGSSEDQEEDADGAHWEGRTSHKGRG